jgi:hypothetical protein
MLHITNGDAAAGPLRTVVPGRVLTSCDVLHEGPGRATPDLATWHAERSQFLAGDRHAELDRIQRELAAADDGIRSAGAEDETVLWFEHDLFDQLLLLRAMTLLPVDARASLICIGAFAGVTPFFGLGQLSGEQLRTLLPTRVAVTAEHRALAGRAWTAFQSPDPLRLLRIAADGGPDYDSRFPFLRAALTRFFEDYPSTRDGLSRTERAVLEALDAGVLSGHDLFVHSQRSEARPFMGDSTFFAIVRDRSVERVPLVEIDGAAALHGWLDARFALTGAGRDVLAGHADAVRLNGIDRWRGGVHLHGAESAWRWDRRRETLVSWL